MKNIFYLLFALPLMFSCGDAGEETKEFPKKFKNKTISEIIIPRKTLKINDDNTFQLHIHYTATGQTYDFTGKIGSYDPGNSDEYVDRFNVSYDGKASYHPRGQYKPSELLPYWDVRENQINVFEKGFNTLKGKNTTNSLNFRVKE
jgi:hypothetical protein